MADVNDLLHYLVQEKALEPEDCFHNDVVDLPNAGACSYRYGQTFKRVISGLMGQYPHMSRLLEPKLAHVTPAPNTDRDENVGA